MTETDTRASILAPKTDGKTTGGSYFVSNYPPFNAWSSEATGEVFDALNSKPVEDTPLGLYVHIPFCRKRCHFCYFKVYTDKNADAIKRYMDAVLAEAARYATMPLIGERKPLYVYFGGGTPSYLSHRQLAYLFEGLQQLLPWDQVREVAFECEPGTLNEKKLKALKELGVTRLSLGVENFNDEILKANNRAHDTEAIDRAYQTAREVGFEQINIDLIAGMLEETPDNWRACVDKAIELKPDCVTVYQMEIPMNTTIYKSMREAGLITAPVADWPTKRQWAAQAFEQLEQAGYTVTSAYTAVRDPDRVKFVYRDALWRGADMLAIGVSSFGHARGVHYQNEKDFEPYLERIEAGELPIRRAYSLTEEQQLIRELVLQFKLGRVSIGYFRGKFDVDITERFAEAIKAMTDTGDAKIEEDQIVLTRDALLRIDTMLTAFFEPRYQPAKAG